jgi:hypothetical protein
MGPNCGPDMKGGTSCSEEDAPVPSEEDACTIAGTSTSAPMSAEETRHMASGIGAGAPVSAEVGRRIHETLVHTGHQSEPH